MSGQRAISFLLDGKIVSLDFQDPSGPAPTTTVLNYLRNLPGHSGVKEGCAEGDCGACTVVLSDPSDDTVSYRAIDSCLVFLPMIHGKELITVENLRKPDGALHPVQQAMVETAGSQCGFCTPGIVMSLFSLYKTKQYPDRNEIDDYLTGNLCRCTGYKPIVEAASRACVHETKDQFTKTERSTLKSLRSIPLASIHIQTGRQLYWRPENLAEALSLKTRHKDALVVCGATDIALRVTKKHEFLPKILDLGAIKELRTIESRGKGLRLGAGASLSTVLEALGSSYSAISGILSVFGSRQIRNLATLGGNLGTASPIGDLLPVLMAYEATVNLRSEGTARTVPIDDFIVGYRKTILRPDELIISVDLPHIPPEAIVKSYKVSKRKDLDISTLSGVFRLTLENGRVQNVKLAYGGMADRTKRALKTEEFIKGKPWDRSTVEKAMDILDGEFNPISDARSGSVFRKIAARNLLLKFWSEREQRE